LSLGHGGSLFAVKEKIGYEPRPAFLPSLPSTTTITIRCDQKWSLLRSRRDGLIKEGGLRLVALDVITSQNASGNEDLLKRFGWPESI
jgi:hypothetical protein